MLSDILAPYTTTPDYELERLLCLPAGMIYTDSTYRELLDNLDYYTLKRTAGQAQAVLNQSLPAFCLLLRREYGIQAVLTGYMLTDWLLDLLNKPDQLVELRKLNMVLPRHVLWDTLPYLVDMLAPMEDGREAWQQALVTVMLPLTGTC